MEARKNQEEEKERGAAHRHSKRRCSRSESWFGMESRTACSSSYDALRSRYMSSTPPPWYPPHPFSLYFWPDKNLPNEGFGPSVNSNFVPQSL
jgi:hypothetical protein